MRLAPPLLALLLASGCAFQAPLPAVGAATVGTVPFSTEGGLEPAGGGRFVAGGAALISGELRFPEGPGPFPAVVLAHGCAGNRNVERAWGPVLRGWGYATFVIDSFGGRGIREVCTGSTRLRPLQRVPDAYGALRLLAARPRIDSRRIALMGFSHGGALTLLAATSWAKDRFVPAGAPGFRAFFAFYPNCNAEFPERWRLAAPLRIHAGELDDWTPASPCVALVAMLRASGQDAAIDVYPGARHAFDQARGERWLPNANNGSHCFPVSASILGPVERASVAGCLRRGATIGGNPKAAAAARHNLHEQLDELIK